METGQDKDKDEITCVTSATVSVPNASYHYVYSGHENGDIKVHRLNLNDWSDKIKLEEIFKLYGHSDPVTFLKPLDSYKFLSYAYNQKTGRQSAKIWTAPQYTSTDVQLGSSSFCHGSVEDATELPNNLLAVGGMNSEAYGCFHVYDTDSRETIHTLQGYVHRPHGMSLATMAFGYLAVLAHCRGLTTWRVTATECTKVDSVEDCQRAYCMTGMPTGEVIIGGFQIQMYKVAPDGKLALIANFNNRNVVHEMYPTFGYGLITVDAGGDHSGILRSWNLLDDPLDDGEVPNNSFGSVASSFGLGRRYDGYTTLIPSAQAVIYANGHKIKGRRALKGHVFKYDPTQEIRKNARLISQAKRINLESGFGKLPPEILLKIIALSGLNEKINWERASRLANLFYGRRV